MDRRLNGTALATYLLLTALFCALPYVLMARYGIRGGAGGYVVALMWGPALAAIVTVWLRGMDWRTLGFAWRDPWSCWMSYVLPIGYALVAYGVIWAAGWGGFARPESIAPLAASIGWTITDPATFVPLYFLFIGITGIVGATAHGLGEEIGWRGFMAPLLHQRYGFTRAAAVTGLIWGMWHVPLIVFADYNSAAPRWFALLCFFVMVTSMSVVMAWFRLRSGSVWPAAIMHGSHNLFIQRIFTPLTGSNGDITAYTIDEFGFMIPLLITLLALVLWRRRGEAITAHDARRAAGEPA